MRGWRAGVLALTALAACGAEPADVEVTTSEPEGVELFAEVLAQHQALNARVEGVAYRLFTAVAEECPRTHRVTGLTAHTLRDYPEDLRPLARHLLGVDEGMSVRSVVDGSPADTAGVEAGDAIRRVGSMPVARSVVADRIWRIAEARELQEEDVALGLVRDGSRVEVDVTTLAACDYPVNLIYSDAVNAHTDGEELYITSELVRRTASDSRLALILAHELAHALVHEGDFTGGPEKELEADARGLELIHAAGFDAAEAIDEMESFGRTLTQGFSGSHPLHGARVKALREQVETLN